MPKYEIRIKGNPIGMFSKDGLLFLDYWDNTNLYWVTQPFIFDSKEDAEKYITDYLIRPHDRERKVGDPFISKLLQLHPEQDYTIMEL